MTEYYGNVDDACDEGDHVIVKNRCSECGLTTQTLTD